MNTTNDERDKKVFNADVVVAGGGVAGLAAAVSAARLGVTTYLIENYGFLGGSATAGLVGRFQAGPDVKGHPVIQGLYKEICDRLNNYEASRGDLFDPEMMKFVAFDLCEEAGVHLILHATVYKTDNQNGNIESLTMVTKQGPIKIKAKTFVDATGDGTVSALAGAQYEVGRKSDGLVQPMTLIFQLGNIDHERLKTADWDALSEIFRKEVKGLAYRGRIFYYEWVEGLLGFVMSHVSKVNPLDVEALTKAEIVSRRQALSVYQFFRRHVPGCERCVIATSATEIGIRESRRIIGDYVLTREDVLSAKKFEDSVGCSTSWIDMHNPEGKGVLHELVIPDDWFEIPFRSILVKGFDNLLVAGRCMSATHEAQGAIREMPNCIAVGQAAGIAAALAVKEGTKLRNLDISNLQQILVSQDVKLRQA